MSFIPHPALHRKRRRGSVKKTPFVMFQEVAEGVSKIEGLCLVGDPKAMVVCFRGVDGLNIYSVVSICARLLLKSPPDVKLVFVAELRARCTVMRRCWATENDGTHGIPEDANLVYEALTCAAWTSLWPPPAVLHGAVGSLVEESSCSLFVTYGRAWLSCNDNCLHLVPTGNLSAGLVRPANCFIQLRAYL